MQMCWMRCRPPTPSSTTTELTGTDPFPSGFTSCQPPVHRWFDKSFNLIVTKNGLSAINFEHAWGDGVAVLRFFNEVYKYTTSHPCSVSGVCQSSELVYTVNHLPPTDQSSSGEGVRKLEFQLNHRLKAAIEEARDKVHDTCNSLSVCAAQYDRYGSSFIKSSGLRADPLMQLAFQVCPPSLTNHSRLILVLQVTYYRLYGELVPSYESCSTAAFR